MPLSFYDPEATPDSAEWLALAESERMRLTRTYHRASGVKLPNAKVHAAVHVVVENQIAAGFAPTCRAMERLQAQGLTRHEATHAIGSVIASFSYELTTAAQPDFNKRMYAAIDALSAEQWNSMAGGPGREG
jgi:hypothetical protein